MVNDQEPRYRLVDSNGNVVGSLFQNADGNVEIQDETGTGSVFGPDGIVTPAIDAGSVSAEQASIGEGDQINQIEFGTVSLPDLSAASTDGWDDRTAENVTVSFSSAFSSAPNVVISLSSSNELLLRADNITTSDFRVVVLNYKTSSQTDITADFVAFG